MTRSKAPSPNDRGGSTSNGRSRPQLGDKRRRPFLVPNYVIDVFGGQLRPPGIALYVALCRHANSEQTAFPFLRTLAKETGMHRGTVIRVLHRLLALGLVEKIRRRDSKHGDCSNLYMLVDPELPPLPPPSQYGGGSSAALLGGSRSATPGVALRDSGGSAARPILNEGSLGEGSPEREAPSPDPSPPFNQAPVGRLVALWMELLISRNGGIREKHAGEIAAEAAELLRLGWTECQLSGSIAREGRHRAEWPREWRAYVMAKVPKVARTPPDPADVAQKRAQAIQEAEEAARSAAELLGGMKPSEFAKQRRKGN